MQYQELMDLIFAFADAKVEFSERGSKHPVDCRLAEIEYDRSMEKLVDFLTKNLFETFKP
ncbi:MAG: hypothetical protein KJN62_00450 [Deltaproteobacteria bacterium]|nr:hypothetical protein [Deltaproteobacteria bacterium]